MQGGQSARLSALAVFMKSAKDLMGENKKNRLLIFMSATCFYHVFIVLMF